MLYSLFSDTTSKHNALCVFFTGIQFEFTSISSRIYIIFWMFFAIIMACAYRSKLFSFLTFPIVEIPPSSFLELSESDYTWGMKSLGGVALIFITKSPLGYVRKVGSTMELYTDKHTCLDNTFKGKFTCIIYRAYIDYMLEVRYWKLRKKFYISDFVSPTVPSCWVLPKHSPLLPTLNSARYGVYEMALAEKYLHDYQRKVAYLIRAKAQKSNSTEDTFDLNNAESDDDDNMEKPLKMINLYGAFFILLFGSGVSLLVLFLENFKQNKLKTKIELRKLKLRAKIGAKMKQYNRNNPTAKQLSFGNVVKIVIPHIEEINKL